MSASDRLTLFGYLIELVCLLQGLTVTASQGPEQPEQPEQQAITEENHNDSATEDPETTQDEETNQDQSTWDSRRV